MAIWDSVKEVLRLAKEVNRLDLHQKLVEMMSQITELEAEKGKLADGLTESRREIERLQEQLRVKSSLTFRDNMYYLRADASTEDGPFCPRCWDVSRNLVRMLADKDCQRNYCPDCKTADRAPTITLVSDMPRAVS